MTYNDDYIRRNKALFEHISTSQHELGELVDTIEKGYGDGTLEEYAEIIGINYHTLKTYITIWRKWKNSEVKPRR
jgi:hypothetical protein